MADTPHVQYQVTRQVPTEQPDGQGQFHKVWRVHYETPSGVKSYVDMPATHYTAENVHAQISHEMQHVEQVNALGDGSAPPQPPPPPLPAG